MEAFWIIIAIGLGVVTAMIAKDRCLPTPPIIWFLAGTFFAIIALPMALFSKPDPKLVEQKNLASGDSKKCPRCAELVKAEAMVCRFCQYTFAAAPRSDSAPKPAVDPSVIVPEDIRTMRNKTCPGCGERLMREAVQCRHCGHVFVARSVGIRNYRR